MIPADLLTVAGAAVVVSILLEVIKRAAAMSDDAISRWAPLMSISLGLVIGTGAALYQQADIVQGLLTGLLAGASSAGLYDGAVTARARVTT